MAWRAREIWGGDGRRLSARRRMAWDELQADSSRQVSQYDVMKTPRADCELVLTIEKIKKDPHPRSVADV
ncbi:Protein of unknown function [Gryllus bimaculatus]|nr:Protein of unknown function [Gryllus bimaculatus]